MSVLFKLNLIICSFWHTFRFCSETLSSTWGRTLGCFIQINSICISNHLCLSSRFTSSCLFIHLSIPLSIHLFILLGKTFNKGHYVKSLWPSFFDTCHAHIHHWPLPFYNTFSCIEGSLGTQDQWEAEPACQCIDLDETSVAMFYWFVEAHAKFMWLIFKGDNLTLWRVCIF